MMSVFATHVSRYRWSSLSFGRPLATQRLNLLRALSSGSEGENDDKNQANVPKSKYAEEPLDDETGIKGWTRRDKRIHPVKAYPDVDVRIPLKESQPRVNLSNLMKSLSEQSMSVRAVARAVGEENNATKSAGEIQGREDGKFTVGAEQRSEDHVDQRISISAFSELLTKSKKADMSVLKGDRGTSDNHSLAREENTATSTEGSSAEQRSEDGVDKRPSVSAFSGLLYAKSQKTDVSVLTGDRGTSDNHSLAREENTTTSTEGSSSAKDFNIENNRDIRIKDVKGTDRFGQPPQDAELASRVKNILSELKVEASHKGLAKGIIGAVRNWGKTHPRYREDLVQEYASQEREFYDGAPAERMDFTSGSGVTLFNADVQKPPVEEAVHQKPFIMELDKGDAIQQLVLADARRNDFEDLITISHKQWQFPVDNEVCKVDEADVGFEEHTFLQYFLDEFPETGPVRRFMELVINGLEQNPHMSVKEKKDQVFWFKNYFSSFSEEELNF